MFRRLLVLALVALLLMGPAFAVSLPSQPRNAEPLPKLTPTGTPDVAGRWEAPFEGQIPAIHLALLPDQRILYWSGDTAGDRDQVYFLSVVEDSQARVLAPPYNANSVDLAWAGDSNTANLFCSGHTILPDGRILSAGGSLWHATVADQDTSFVDGVPDARVFDWRTDSWERVDDMDVPRWYPTVMTLADGGLVASGIYRLTDPSTHQPSMETFDGSEWSTVMGGDNILPLYPRLTQVPSGPMKGDLYYETGGTLWGPFGEHPQEATWNLAQAFDFDAQAWRVLGPSIFGVRQSPNNVLLPLDPADGYRAKMLTFAGTLQRSILATNLAEIADLSTEPPTRSVAAPLHTPRWQSTGILLPDGQVLAVGGALYDNVMLHGFPDPAVMTAELYDPAADMWTELAPMTIPREYHGTALLLPDGRVLVGGHVPDPIPWTVMRDNIEMANQSPQTKFEIFEPPYLHWGARPRITAAPTDVGLGATFSVQTPDAATVKDAILIRHGAVTHSSDPGQRGIILPIAGSSAGSLTFAMPADADLVTPGPWMLFLRSEAPGRGLVPSVAASMMVH